MPEAKGAAVAARSWKSTLNMLETAFPMKANLPSREPVRLEHWKQMDLYGAIRRARAGAPRFILHDGPPYANGAIHLGHALNKCIKDFVVKSKTMAGFDAPYVPGWDCHGLPIEIKVDEKLGRKKLAMDPLAVREACRDYAQTYVDLQRCQFERLGILGAWNAPYLTMNPGYEAAVAELFFAFFEKGFVYKGLKPVYWCTHDQTALAEAEVEYAMHTSPSVYVRYRLTSDPAAISPDLRGLAVSTIIWTTTPWTLPASLAIAFHPDLTYVALRSASGEVFVVAEALASQVREACNLPDAQEIARFPGSALDRTTFEHPFLDREILGVNADYVTTDQGTGAVHTAPSHGPDDFATGQRYGLPVLRDVDNAGRLRDGLPEYDGLTVQAANRPILELLRERGALLGSGEIEHSYPHCWRCHNPVIYRATEQWFIGMETPVAAPDGSMTTFRQRTLEVIPQVRWDPAWGEGRISNMIAARPDWCISRQRIWGVPIPVFLCDGCGEPLNDPAVNRAVTELFRREGSSAWYSRSAADLLPAGTQCRHCPASATFSKEMDILDVWFESGASWHAVLDADPDLRRPPGEIPADLYTEGGDQHRGWFHSSLLTSVAMRGHAPYRTVATSGWTLDEQGRAFSKSLGNGVDPVDVANRLGGEVIRLWVASVDFREDVAASENLMLRVSENYRKLRNTLRFLLGNLRDFATAEHGIPFAALEPLDQYILARTAALDTRVRRAYDLFEFHRAYHAINEFTNTELSALYLDVLKDRLYTLAPNAPARRSAQTTLWHIAEALTRLIAPILSFTADEVWELLPPVDGREPSVHLALFSDLDAVVSAESADLLRDWETLLAVREQVNARLEIDRAQKLIGKSLEAEVALEERGSLPSTAFQILQKYERALPELFNVSVVHLAHAPQNSGDASPEITVTTSRSRNTRCERCWRHVPDVGDGAAYPSVCLRCADALAAIGYPPYDVEGEER